MALALENFGKYVLLEKIASGGMAEVYLAKSLGASGVNKFIAIKRILPQYSDNIEFIEMFKEEAKIAVNLNHSNVVSIFDFGIESKQFYLVMEFVEGQNLRQITNFLKKENIQLTIDQVVYIVKEVAAGLDHAHRCIDGTTGKPLNITHRDMSPQNVMISFEGEVKVVDFGIAKAENQVEATRVGTIKGKFGYMSPEQADGQIVDLRTDIFSLGIVLWELLANDRLFTAGNEAATLRKIRDCQIPSLRKINPAIPAELERICNKALAKEKSLRYQTSAAFYRDLNRFLNTQYPEFSSQDFSRFMKESFSSLYLENRKKLVEYSKAQAPNAAGPLEDKTEVTQTESFLQDQAQMGASKARAGLSIPQSQPAMMGNLNLDPKSTSKVKLEDLKQGLTNVTRTKTKASTSLKVNGGAWHPNAANSDSLDSFRFQKKSQSLNSAVWIFSLILVAVGFWFYRQNKMMDQRAQEANSIAEQESADPSTTTAHQNSDGNSETMHVQEMSSTVVIENAAVFIESIPPGARVLMNDKDTGQITPARITVEKNKSTKISLLKDGYLPYDRTEHFPNLTQSLKATLQLAAQIGYISLDVPNGGSSPVVIINGTRLQERLPLKLYAVPANIPITIKVSNPFAKLSAEQSIVVGPNQKRQLKMLLTADPKASTPNR